MQVRYADNQTSVKPLVAASGVPVLHQGFRTERPLPEPRAENFHLVFLSGLPWYAREEDVEGFLKPVRPQLIDFLQPQRAGQSRCAAVSLRSKSEKDFAIAKSGQKIGTHQVLCASIISSGKIAMLSDCFGANLVILSFALRLRNLAGLHGVRVSQTQPPGPSKESSVPVAMPMAGHKVSHQPPQPAPAAAALHDLSIQAARQRSGGHRVSRGVLLKRKVQSLNGNGPGRAVRFMRRYFAAKT